MDVGGLCLLLAPGSVCLGRVCLHVHEVVCVGPFIHARLCGCVWARVQVFCESGLPGLCVSWSQPFVHLGM